MAELNFSTRMLLPAAALILLSVATVAEEAKRCYWCGPLAEQVHRSQRTPSCGEQLQETMCDKGYTHCAVVATSPPYVESRLCMKFYQDECYSLYCNSSKTWRMICPCQGDLCNGQNTDREITAFATLAKIVGKNNRSKRSLIGANGFLSLTPRQKVTNQSTTSQPENQTTHSAMQFEETLEENIDVVETTSVMSDNGVVEEHGENEDKNIKENTVQDDDSEMQGDQPIEAQVENNEAVATTIVDDDNSANTKAEHSEINKVIDEIKTDKVTPTMTMSEEINDNDKPLTVTVPAQFVKETQKETKDMPTRTSMMPTSIEIELSVVHAKNPTDNLPPPEALQQNVTPASVSSPTTMGTIETSTNVNLVETTTHSLKETVKNVEKEMTKKNDTKQNINKNNGDKQITACVWALVLLMNIHIYLYI